MVFESLITDLINRYLGDYIEALNASQLKIGLLGGNAQLENLDIKANAFDELNLPVKVLQGHIGTLVLKIPFKNLYTEPTIAELDGLYVLVVPNTAVKYDTVKENQYKREAKQKELRDIEEARAFKLRGNKTQETKGDSFGEKLAAQIIKNLQIDIRNIHIRYEDSYSIPGQTFSVGFTLSGLTLKTTNSSVSAGVSQNQSIHEFSKMIKLTSLAVYWNHNCPRFSERAKGPLRSAMRSSIAGPDNPKTGFTYLVKPISATAVMHMHNRPEETGFTTPQLKLKVDFSEIELNFSLFQFHDVTSFLDATDRMITRSKYRKYRPDCALRGNCKIWWMFAYTAILEESVRRRRQMWSWVHIKQHRRFLREYIQLWKRRLHGEKLNQSQTDMLVDYEDALDVFNIVLARQQAELQYQQDKSKHSEAKSKRGNRGWFGWFSKTSSDISSAASETNDSETQEIVKRLQSEMTSEEKARLFSAIDYSEGGSGTKKWPETFVSAIISVNLNQFSFVLLNEQLTDPRILHMAVNKLFANVEQRQGADALKVQVYLDSLEALGAHPSAKQADLARSSNPPVLVTSHVINTGSAPPEDHLVTVMFEKNPLDRKADQRVMVKTDPVQVVYDAETINKIVHFLTPPEDLRLQELSSQVLSSIEDVKEITVSGLRHLASRREYTDVVMDIRPSYVILPDNGIFRSDCRFLLFDFGSLSIRSVQNEQRNKFSRPGKIPATDVAGQSTEQSETIVAQKSVHPSFEDLKEDAYDRYEISLTSMQLIMVEKGDDWQSLRQKNKSSCHILRPLAMNFNLKRCLVRNDANLPKIIMDGCLPVFSVDLTDGVLKSLCELISNVPFPEPDKRLSTPENPSEVLKDAVLLPDDDYRHALRAARRLVPSPSLSTMSSVFSDTLDEWNGDDDEEEDSEDSDDDPHNENDYLETGQDVLQMLKQSDTLDSGAADLNLKSRASKITRRLKREAMMRRRKHANLIDLKMEFVIRMIQIQLLERKLEQKEDQVVLTLNVHDVGAEILKRRWNQELKAHIGALSMSVPRFIDRHDNQPICLARTKRHVKDQYLLVVHFLVAEKTAPDFEKRYNNTRHHLKCEFKEVELSLHQESLLLLIGYANNLLKDMILPSSDSDGPPPISNESIWASRVGDAKGATTSKAREIAEAENAKQLPDKLTAVQAVEEHLARRYERRSIRLDAAENALKAGHVMVIREVNIIQWLIKITLDKVTLTLCSNATDLLSTTMHGLNVDIQSTYLATEVSGILSEFTVADQIEQTDYRKLIWVDPADSIVSMQLTMFTKGTKSPGNAWDPSKLDMDVGLQLGKMHVIFLNHFVTRFLDFMEAFQEQTKHVLSKVQELSDTAVQQVQEVVNKEAEFRLGLNVVAQAPAIYVPQHSFSSKALMIDLGRITYSNRFEFVPADQQSHLLPDALPSPTLPRPGIMLEHVDIRLDNLRLSRAVLTNESIDAEKGIIHPINIGLQMRRNLNPNTYTAIPLLKVNGATKSIQLCMCQGDYRAVQEVIVDNFSEIPPHRVRTNSAQPRKSWANQPTGAVVAESSSKGECERNISKSLPTSKVTTAVQFMFEMDSITFDLFSSDPPISEWSQSMSAESRLALLTLNGFSVVGKVATDSSSEIETKLYAIQLTDTRPYAHKQVTNGQILRVLDHTANTDGTKELIVVKFEQEASLRQKIRIQLRSIYLCASVDYLLALTDFHLKSYPQFERKVDTNLPPITEGGKRKRRKSLPRAKTKRPDLSDQLTEYPNNIELSVEIGNPELVLIEDITKADSNCIKITCGLLFRYTMQKEVIVMDASVKDLVMVASPYNEPIRGRFSKEVISPTEVNFYLKQPISGSMQGSVHIDTLLVNINPGTIQLLSHIATTLQAAIKPSGLTDKSSAQSSNSQIKLQEDDTVDFWDPVPLEDLHMPYLETDMDEKFVLLSESVTASACDVSKVLEHIEDRRAKTADKDTIVVRLQTVRIVLESQLGSRSMPMLVLESAVDGEIISPARNMDIKLSVELCLSYYNDTLNQWEQLLETLPDDDERMWSFQLEMTTSNVDELVADEDLDEVGCLQASTNSIMLVSRDNLELTLSKSALDLLSNLGRTFEAACKQQFVEPGFELGGESAAPYRIENRTGWPVALRFDDKTLRMFGQQESGAASVTPVRKRFASVIRELPNSILLGRVESSKPQLVQIAEEADQSVQKLNDDQILLASGFEIGFIEPKRMTQKSFSIHSTDKSHHMICITWQPEPKAPTQPEVRFPLSASGNVMMNLRKSVESGNRKSGTSERLKEQSIPVVAHVTTNLGMRMISLRSTIQLVNDTSEVMCLYSLASLTTRYNHPTLLVKLEAGEIYALPVGVVNSTAGTGFFISPDVGTLTLSTQPAYWPESACAGKQPVRPTELIYLAPMADRSNSVTHNQQLQSISDTLVKEQNQQQSVQSKYKWPIQLLECRSSSSDLVYYYNITTLHVGSGESLTSLQPAAKSTTTSAPQIEQLVVEEFKLIIRNSVVLHNQLPIPINYVVSDGIGEIAAGSQCTMRATCPTNSSMDIWFEYDKRVYQGKLVLNPKLGELSAVTFESREGYELLSLHIGLRNVSHLGQRALTLYSPYWLINKTGKELVYKSADDVEVPHPADFNGALLYSTLSKSLFGKRKATVRVGDSNWSDKFSLDTVGNSGRVNCRTKDKMSYEIGMRINLSSSGLTKIVTFMPYFMLINKAPITLECAEVTDLSERSPASRGVGSSDWIHIPVGEAVPFWPKVINEKKMLMRCRVNEHMVTDEFPFEQSSSILMKLRGKYAGIFVEVQVNEEASVITLQLYQEGMALVRVVNHLGDMQSVTFQQRGVEKLHQLEAGMSVMYTWDSPRAERELIFYCDEKGRKQSNKLTTDCVEEFYVNDTKAYWVSFMWNMQRILLFTEDMNAAKNARLSADLEKIDQEIIISLQSIGLSLVDNVNRAEVAYLSVTSSGVKWSQVKRGNRLKPLKPGISDCLERAYTNFVNQLRVGDTDQQGVLKLNDCGSNTPVEVDFNQMMMLKPNQCALRRAFEPGVFLQYKNSVSQMQLHTKIFRVQLDNQKMDCTFPVVLAPYPQPKSVSLDSGPKPLVELSAIIARTTNPSAFRFKYFRVLIQEMLCKLDQGFLNDLFDFFAASVKRIPEEEAFKADCQLIQNRLIDTPVLLAQIQGGTRSIFDNFHISPIKMHVSFSLTGSTEGKTTAFPSEVLNLFLQSIGVALTDVQDVIFKLAYFERQATIMTMTQMTSEMTRHYVGQGVRQLYVLVLGLDVLGNPFGVIRGMAQGVEDLFYEPVKGAVLGPEEFAEGVALGVKSLFGHAVGGAAGAVSRITGTIGKGIAALTLDEDYKRHRREQLARRPDSFGAGMAQGGRGLVMGVFHGVTGVFVKPVEGAKKEGVEGFFKGVGKGLVGAVTRPVSGVVDFASSSFDGIRRIADSVDETGRIRPPRFIRSDGIIRPYERHEAEGHLLLRNADKTAMYGQYTFHISANKGTKFLLLTSSHLFIVESMDLLGTWNIDWQTKVEALSSVPVVNRTGILITLKEKQKKFLSSGNQTKQFDCDSHSAQAMVRAIDANIFNRDMTHGGASSKT